MPTNEIRRRRFEADGFAVLRNAVPPALVVALRGAVEVEHGEAISCGKEPTDTGLWPRIAVAAQIARSTNLCAIARELLRSSSVRLWQDQLIVKRACAGSETELHQDAPYWPMESATAVTCWIPLGDVEERSGAMRFVRGSHKSAVARTVLPGALHALLGRGDEGWPDVTDAETVDLAVGDCTFHSGHVVHGAHGNRGDVARLAYKVVYMADGTTFRFQWHSATEGQGFREGDPFAGANFPVVG